jgi:hypothetical protein
MLKRDDDESVDCMLALWSWRCRCACAAVDSAAEVLTLVDVLGAVVDGGVTVPFA